MVWNRYFAVGGRGCADPACWTPTRGTGGMRGPPTKRGVWPKPAVAAHNANNGRMRRTDELSLPTGTRPASANFPRDFDMFILVSNTVGFSQGSRPDLWLQFIDRATSAGTSCRSPAVGCGAVKCAVLADDDAGIRPEAIGAGETVEDRFSPCGARGVWRREFEDGAAARVLGAIRGVPAVDGRAVERSVLAGDQAGSRESID